MDVTHETTAEPSGETLLVDVQAHLSGAGPWPPGFGAESPVQRGRAVLADVARLIDRPFRRPLRVDPMGALCFQRELRNVEIALYQLEQGIAH